MIHIGASGFSYDDWRGHWYSPNLPKAKMFDEYAERFSTVEINSTFYRIPGPTMMQSLVRRARGRITFAIKMSRKVTHEGDQSVQTARGFARAAAPAAQSGVLGAVILQFPFRFHCTRENRRYIEASLLAFSDFPLIVEIRHDSWRSPEGWDFFRERSINLCITDMPRLRGLPRSSTDLTGPIAYMRFHGRNSKNWFESDSPSAPYDYNYSKEQLLDWVEPIKAMEKKAETTFVFFNNHVNGQAPQNARLLQTLLGQEPAIPVQQEDLFSGR